MLIIRAAPPQAAIPFDCVLIITQCMLFLEREREREKEREMREPPRSGSAASTTSGGWSFNATRIPGQPEAINAKALIVKGSVSKPKRHHLSLLRFYTILAVAQQTKDVDSIKLGLMSILAGIAAAIPYTCIRNDSPHTTGLHLNQLSPRVQTYSKGI